MTYALTHFLQKSLPFLKTGVKAARALSLCWLLFFAASTASAAQIAATDIHLDTSDETLTLSADFQITLPPTLEEALNRGVILQFLLEFEMSEPRWYWFDGKAVRKERSYQLSYHALTRQYRLTMGGLHQSFARLSEAMATLSSLRHWQVASRSDLKPEQAYLAALRFRLDLSQLPKTLQVSSLGNRDWQISSDWLTFSYTLPEALPKDAAETAPKEEVK